MHVSSFIGLVNNAALLLALGLLYDMLGFRTRRMAPLLQQILTGVLAGGLGIAIMLNPLDFGHGVVFDTRSVLLCITGLFLGTLPTVLAVLMTGAFRLAMGGVGVSMGIAVIVTSGGIGLVWRHLGRNREVSPSLVELYLLGIVVHVAMLGWALILPREVARDVLTKISLPVMLIYPLATALLGMLLVNRGKRRKALEALRTSEEKFRNIFQHHTAVKLLIDPDSGRIVEANAAAEAFYGWPGSELNRMRVQDINTLPAERVQAEMAKAKSRPADRYEFRHRLADGTIRDVEVFSSRVEIDGKPYLHSIVHDVTGRKQAENALRERERFLDSILHTTADGFWVIDAKGCLVDVNAAYCAMSGYRREELIGMPISALDALETPGDVAARIERIKAAGSDLFESRHRRKDGSTFPVEVSTSWLEDASGRFVCFTRDHSLRKQREERIALLGRMLDAAPASIMVHDAQGRIHYANQMACDLHGYANASELMALTMHDIDAPESAARYADRIQRVAENAEARFEVVHLRRDGATFPLEVAAKSIAWEGEPAVLSIGVDISERKQSDEALAHSHDMMRYIIEHANSAVAVHDRDLNYIYVSQRYLEQYKVEEKDVIGRHHYEVFPDLPRKWREVHQRALAGEVSRAERDDYPREDGRVEWTRWECRPWYGADGATIGGFVVYTEVITDRVLAEEALRASEEFQRAMIEASPLGIVSLSLDGHVTSWNAAAASMFGWPEREVLGKRLPFVPQDQQAASTASIEDAAAGDAFPQTELTRLRKDGSPIEISVSTAPLRDSDDRVKAVMLMIEDITERKQAQKEREESLELLHNLARLVPGVIYQYRLYPDGSSAFPYASPGIYTIYEVTPEGVREDATPVFGRLHPEDHDRVAEAILASARTLEMFYCEFRVVLPEQGLRWRWSQAKPQRMDDGGTLWYGIILDVTALKQAEAERAKLQDQLQQAQKMEAVGRLAGGVAHDYNNMLGVIMGYTELSLEKLAPENQVRSDLEEVMSAAQRSKDITRQLLAFSRQQTIAPRALDLNATVESMLKMLRRLIGEDIDLAWLPGSTVWPVFLDPSQLDQIMVNLCVNARDAIADVGKVTIETGTKTFDDAYCAAHAEFVPGDYVLLSVSDDGCGMDKKTQQLLFEPFFTTKEVGKGTGLGLATVFGIVRQNEGFMNVYSEPGQGTIFRIYLPRHQVAAEPERPKAPERADARGDETVLLVEDEPSILRMTAKMLGRLGYRVLKAGTPEEALRLAEVHAGGIDLLMTDVVMPAMNGRELSGRLQGSYPSLRVLFMSGYTANVIAHHGVLDKGVHFIQKPFSKNDLAAKVRGVLDAVDPISN